MSALADTQAAFLNELKASIHADAAVDAPILEQIKALQATLTTAKDPTAGTRKRTYQMLVAQHQLRPVAPIVRPPAVKPA